MVELTEADYRPIEHCFPKHYGTVTYSNLQALNAILHIAENGAKWRKLPEKYGHWHTIYTRMRAWAKSCVLARVFRALQQEQIIRIKVETASLDSTSIKVHPDGTGALKRNGPQSIGRSRGGLTTKIHLVASYERTAFCFSLSPGQDANGPQGRDLLKSWSARRPSALKHLIMDKAYESDKARQLVMELELTPVVPPKANRHNPWEYDRELYKKRNEVERLLKGFRRSFSRFGKLDQMFAAFIHVALIFNTLFTLTRPSSADFRRASIGLSCSVAVTILYRSGERLPRSSSTHFPFGLFT